MGNFQKDSTGWGLVIFGNYVAPFWAVRRTDLIKQAEEAYRMTWRGMKKSRHYKARAVRMKLNPQECKHKDVWSVHISHSGDHVVLCLSCRAVTHWCNEKETGVHE